MKWTIISADKNVVVLKNHFSSMPSPDDWLTRMKSALDSMPGVSVVGVTRIAGDKLIHSMGEMVIHPKGLHHLSRGYPGFNTLFPVECDAIDGGVVMIAANEVDAGNILDQFNQPAGALTYCLQDRLNGGRCITIPDVFVTDHSKDKPTEKTRVFFKEHWGIDLLLPDMEAIHSTYRKTNLLWNIQNFGTYIPFRKYEERPLYHWHNYKQVPVFKQRTDAIVEFISSVGRGALLDAGCGDGLFSHLLRSLGLIPRCLQRTFKPVKCIYGRTHSKKS